MSSKKGSSIEVAEKKPDVEECLRPEFIYGGPFIKVEKPDPFLTTATPINLQLQGTFKNISRTRWVSRRQLDILWEFLNSHKEIATARNRSLQAKEYSKRKWKEIAQTLNAQGDGSHKEWNDWCKYWVDYKAKLKKRVSTIRSARLANGEGPSTEQPLSDIEAKFLQVLGEHFGQGLPGVPVEPLPENSRSTIAAEDALEPPGDPLLIVLPQVKQEVLHEPQEVSAGADPPGGSASGSGLPAPRRRRRRRREPPPLSREAARRALVESSRLRAEASVRSSHALDTIMNTLLRLERSFAYYSLKERMPVILTKVIDQLSRQGSSSGGSGDEVQKYIQLISKLKNDLITNKPYDLFTVDSPDARKWNLWIEALDNRKYFTNVWVFSECYVYRKLREGCELHKGLNNFDPFGQQKEQAFAGSLEPMCVVADRMADMLPESDKDKRKADFITLLKICLWANKCDLSLSVGEPVSMGPAPPPPTKGKDKGAVEQPSTPLVDPIQMVLDLKDKLLVDDTAKIVDQVVAKAETVQKAIEANTALKVQCSCHRLATAFGVPLQKEKVVEAPPATGKKGSAPPTPAPSPPASPPPEGEEEPKIPCPAKMVLPQCTMFDIVCDNAGYELFADLCLAHFLISQKIVQKIRFHVKNMPWFVSDVTKKDFNYVIDSCMKASYNRTVPPEPKPEPKEGEEPAEAEPPRVVSAQALQTLGAQWRGLLDDGVFLLMAEDYWTWPHVYKDMKKYDYNLYRKLQYAVAILFKGDLNYRKLLGERNCNPVLGFEPALQGFIPAPIIAIRTVKADLICGLPKGKWEQLNGIDPKWMETGDYGVIQFCPKAEPLKPSDQPCIDYGDSCFGEVCPTHTDM